MRKFIVLLTVLAALGVTAFAAIGVATPLAAGCPSHNPNC